MSLVSFEVALSPTCTAQGWVYGEESFESAERAARELAAQGPDHVTYSVIKCSEVASFRGQWGS